MALMVGSAEFFGGIALLLGLLTRPAALVSAFTMLMAISVDYSNVFFVANKGYEFGLILAAACLSLAFQGAGIFSLDRLLASRFSDYKK
jgi:putative oxidoreductase